MKKNKVVLLKGEGINQHVLYGDFEVYDGKETFSHKDFPQLEVSDNSVLKHEDPSGNFAEHYTLSVDKGQWVMGKQVEFSPFTNTIERVWD